MTTKGKILKIHDKEQVTDKFAKRRIWIETEEQYPQHLEIEFVQDACGMLDEFSKDEKVEISINLRGRGWTNKEGKKLVFNTLNGWKIKRVSDEQAAPPTPEPQQSDDEDSLPF